MKQYVAPESLRKDSYKLASIIIDDGYVPDYIVAIWRGGAPIGCYVHEYFKYFDMNIDHIAIRTSRYCGIDQTKSTVSVHNLGYLSERVKRSDKILLIDDVYDTGLSIKAIFEAFQEAFGKNCPIDVRVATVYFKPKRNKTIRIPDYYVIESDEWIVFPHELEGLSIDEISENFGKEIGDTVRNTKENLSK